MAYYVAITLRKVEWRRRHYARSSSNNQERAVWIECPTKLMKRQKSDTHHPPISYIWIQVTDLAGIPVGFSVELVLEQLE
jgi:hypothetical protein